MIENRNNTLSQRLLVDIEQDSLDGYFSDTFEEFVDDPPEILSWRNQSCGFIYDRNITDHNFRVGCLQGIGASIVLPILSWTCQWLVQNTQKDAPIFTQNHVAYNQNFLNTIFALVIITLYMMITQKNCGILINRPKFLEGGFILTRIVALLYVIVFVLKDFAQIYIDTFSLCCIENWRTKNEPFVTFGSYFNAASCWLLSTIFLIFNLILLGHFILKFRMSVYKTFCTFLTIGGLIEGLCLELPPERYSKIFEYLEDRILTDSQRSNRPQRQAKNNRYEAIELINETKVKYQSKSQKQKECTVCLNEFQENEMVVKLKCSDMHVFHHECLKKNMQFRTECPLCRSDIV